MTAELRRAFLLAAVGAVSGFAIIVAVFGPGEIMKRARSVVGPAEGPLTLADRPGAPAEKQAEPERDARARSEATAPSDAKPEKQAALPKDLGVEPSATPPIAAKDGPSLDIVRVEPSGDAVIAGRAAPNASVEILRDNKPIAAGKADETGQFAIVPPALPTGNSELTFRTVTPDGKQAQGKDSVAVVVDANRKTKPLVALTAPDKPTRVVSLPEGQTEPGKAQSASPARPEEPGKMAAAEPPKTPAAVAKPGGAAVPVKVVSVDAQDGGRLDVSAKGNPAATLRLYLNDTMIASGQAAPDGSIAFTIGRGVRAGAYQVRVDQVDPNTGKVEQRAQVAFAMPETAASKLAKAEPPPAPGRAETAKAPPPVAKPESAPSQQAKIEPSTPAVPRTEAPKAPPSAAKPESAAPKLAQAEPSAPAPARREMARPLPSLAKPESAPSPPATPAAPEASGTRLPPAASAPLPKQAEPEKRPVAETPAVAAAAGKPEAPKPSSEKDDRTAAALSPVLPPSAKPAAQAAIAETPSASLPLVPTPETAPTSAPETATPGTPSTTEAAPMAPIKPGTVFVAEINTAKITRGDNLWQISRKSYGSGFRYTVIYDANKDQIRDPDLIYPGQIFVLPKGESDERQSPKRG